MDDAFAPYWHRLSGRCPTDGDLLKLHWKSLAERATGTTWWELRDIVLSIGGLSGTKKTPTQHLHVWYRKRKEGILEFARAFGVDDAYELILPSRRSADQQPLGF